MAMFRHTAKKRARILSKQEFRHALTVAGATTQPERNRLLLCLSHALGLRCTEMALITIEDVLMPSGRLRGELSVRAEVAKGCHPRTVPMTSKTLLRALEDYLVFRVKNGIGTSLNEAFRGLLPTQPLIFSNRGGGFSMALKPRLLETGQIEDYWCCDSLESWFRNFYPRAGLRGATSHSGRRSYATRLLEAGVSLDDIAILLGHQSIDFSRPYLEIDPLDIRQAYLCALSNEPSDDTYDLPVSAIVHTTRQKSSKKVQQRQKSQMELVIEHIDNLVATFGEHGVAPQFFEQLVRFTGQLQSGVYFLTSEQDEIGYVGQARCLPRRIGDHVDNKRMRQYLNKVFFIPVPVQMLSETEAVFINLLRPILNRQIPPNPLLSKWPPRT